MSRLHTTIVCAARMVVCRCVLVWKRNVDCCKRGPLVGVYVSAAGPLLEMSVCNSYVFGARDCTIQRLTVTVLATGLSKVSVKERILFVTSVNEGHDDAHRHMLQRGCVPSLRP